jgi:PAS domain S-box-containing protein
MKQIFLNNLDLIYLFYGAAFFFLGTACFVLYLRERSQKTFPWLVLSLFGFLHGYNEWLDMLAYSFSDKHFLTGQRDFFLAFSFFCLLEFSRQSLQILKKIRIPVAVYGLFLGWVAVAYFQARSFSGHQSVIRYYLGFLGGLGASCSLFCYVPFLSKDGSGRFFKSLGALFFIYAVAAGLIVPESRLFLSRFFNQEMFLKFTGIPIQLVRGVLVAVIAFLFIYRAAKITLALRGGERGGRSVRVILISYLVLYCIFLIFGYRFISVLTAHEKSQLQKIILSDAKLLRYGLGPLDAASVISPRDFASYPQVRQAHRRLSHLAELSTFAATLYLVTLDEDRPHFTISSRTQVFPHYFTPPYGQKAPLSVIMDAYRSKMPTVFSGYRDAQGYETQAIFVPLLNTKSEVVALLGIDLDGRRWQSELLRIRLLAIFVIMAFLVLLIVAYAFLILFALRSIELQIQKDNLDKALARLKETQSELTRSEETFRGILNNSPNPIFGFDRDLKLVFWNHGAEVFYGYGKDEIIDEKNPVLNKKMSELFGITKLVPEIEAVFSGVPFCREILHQTRRGAANVVMTLFPVKDPLGHILFAIGLIQDMSEHKRFEETLAAVHAQLKSVLDGATRVSIIAADLNGVITVFNKGAGDLLGYQEEEVVGRKNLFFCHVEDEIRLFGEEFIKTLNDPLRSSEAYAQFLKVASSTELEWTYARRDGTRVSVEISVTELYDAKNEPAGYLAIAVDLTARKSAERAFSDSQQKYRELADSLNIGIFRTSPGFDGRFLEVSPPITRMLGGASSEEVKNHAVCDFYADKAKRQFFSEKMMKYGSVKNEEFEVRTLQGGTFWASISAEVKTDIGGRVYFEGILEDITERKQMEFKVYEERDRLRKIATSIGAGLCLVDVNFDIVWVNETLEKWFGGIDTIKGKKCYATYQLKNTICAGCPTHKALKTGQMETAETRSVFPDGRVMDFLIICSPIKNEKGEVVQVLELTLDMTERKKILELLEYERALSRNIIDSIGEELMILDAQKRVILDVNREFCEKAHLKKEDVIGKVCDKAILHPDATYEDCGFDEVVEQGRVVAMTHVHQRSNGRKFYCDVTLSPLKDEKGQIIGVIHLSRDISDRKKLEDDLRQYSQSLESLVKERTKALQKSEMMFRKLFESAQDGILIIDFESGKIIDINPYVSDLLECSREEIQGQDYRSLPINSESKIFDKAHQELKHKFSVFYNDVVLRTSSGKEISVEVGASLYFVEDKKIVQFNIRDLTERKKVEKIKTEFVSMVSHELRTPLSAIKEGVEIVADGTQGKLNKSQAECLDIALSNIKRLNRLIGDILDISKIQSNLLKVNSTACSIYDIVDQVYNLVRIEIEKRGMVFVTDLEKDLPRVYADKDRLIQVLINLLNNAVKFTREHSKITLSCRRSAEGVVEFSVKDEGAGIPPEELARLFGKFVQLDSTLVRRVGGTGLGLYISRNLVEAMSGKIWAESQIGAGTFFKFTIPIFKEKQWRL